jgi:glucose/mannose-6-phosphate isomerase
MHDMRELVAAFPHELRDALDIANRSMLTPFLGELDHVVIAGLGGSGIGGSILQEICQSECPVPVTVIKNYFCPAFVSSSTLMIACSYSGNTEETLSVTEKAALKGAKITVVTSGGKLADIAAEKGYDLIQIPGGRPPRASLGYSLGQLFHVFSFHRLIGNDWKRSWTNAADLIENEQEQIKAEAEKAADVLQNSFPILYAESGYDGLATRICQQLSENSKMLCSNRVIPEMNHNELVGWREKQPGVSVLFLETGLEYYRNAERIRFVKEVVSHYTEKVHTLFGKGGNALEKTLYLINLTDYVSCVLAERRGFDASEIEVINRLKARLNELA